MDGARIAFQGSQYFATTKQANAPSAKEESQEKATEYPHWQIGQSQGHEEKERPILVSWGGAISTSSCTSVISRYSILKSNNHVKRAKVCKSFVVWL